MVPALKGADRDAVLAELCQKLAAEGFVDDAGKLLESALKREAIISTAVENGLAFPHVRCVEGGALTMALGIAPKAIKFDPAGKASTRHRVFHGHSHRGHAFYLKLLAGLLAGLPEGGKPRQAAGSRYARKAVEGADESHAPRDPIGGRPPPAAESRMDSPRNLVLVGFMGTGKSAVGRRVAALAAAPFLDMDAELERRAGKSIARIFAEDGEPAFRDLESQLAEEWGRRQGAVISCGGGVVLREANLRAPGGQRTAGVPDGAPRGDPGAHGAFEETAALAGEDPERKIRDLLAARAPYYAAIPVQIDTSDLGPEELAAQLLARWKQPG
jgi:shikimate kinase